MSEWLEDSLGNLASVEIGGTPTRDVHSYWAGENQDGYPWVSIADLGPRHVYDTRERITELGVRSSNTKLVPKGTLMMSFKLTIGRVGIAGQNLFTNEAIAAIIPRNGKIDPEFLYYLLPPIASRSVTDTAIKGSTLNKEKLGKLKLRFPCDLHYQHRIAEILSTLDDTIEQTEALIAKYQQIKAGLMHDLFTRGVTPDGRLRRTRDEASQLYKETPLGWIPKEWEISNCATEFAIDSGITLGPHRRPKRMHHPYLRVANVFRDRIVLDEIEQLEAFPWEVKERSLETFDLLVVEGHANCNEVGRCAMVFNDAEGMLFQNHLFRLRAVRIDPRYALLWLNSFQAQRYWYINCATSSGLNTINRKKLGAMPVFIPSEQEQNLIVAASFACREAGEANFAWLTKLRLQKRGLMHDLLTGHVRVKVLEAVAA